MRGRCWTIKSIFIVMIFFFKQMALAPYRNLPQEIESLKLVIEIRNEEIQKLKNRNVELEKQVGLSELFNFWLLITNMHSMFFSDRMLNSNVWWYVKRFYHSWNVLQAGELINAKEKIIAQQQKIENLEAIISMKTDHEK